MKNCCQVQIAVRSFVSAQYVREIAVHDWHYLQQSRLAHAEPTPQRRRRQHLKRLRKLPSAKSRTANIDMIFRTVLAFHIIVVAFLLQFPAHAILLSFWATATTSRELLAWRTVDSERKQYFRLTEVRVPVPMYEEIEQYHHIDDDNREEDDIERLLVVLVAS